MKTQGLRSLTQEQDDITSSLALLPHASRITVRSYWLRYRHWDVDRSLRWPEMRDALIAYGEARLLEIASEIAGLREEMAK